MKTFFQKYLPLVLAGILTFIIIFGAFFIFSSRVAQASWYADSSGEWHYRTEIVVDHTKVSGTSDLVNFPLYFSVTDPDLRSIANGGKVASNSGDDILFTSGNGLVKWNHDIKSYDPTTGSLTAWVEVPSLSPMVDTSLYIYFDNASSSPQQDPDVSWDGDHATSTSPDFLQTEQTNQNSPSTFYKVWNTQIDPLPNIKIRGGGVGGNIVVPPSFIKAQAGVGSGNDNTGTTGYNLTFGSTPGVGDVIVCGVLYYNGTASPPASIGVTDGNANTFTESPSSPSTGFATDVGFTYLFYFINTSGTASSLIQPRFTALPVGGESSVNCDDFTVTGGTAFFDHDAIGSGSGLTINTPTVTVSGSPELLYNEAVPFHSITSVNSPWSIGGAGVNPTNADASGYEIGASSNTALNDTVNTTGEWGSVAASFGITPGGGSGGSVIVGVKIRGGGSGGGGLVTCGNTGIQTSTDTGDGNTSLAIPDCVPASNSTVQSCAIGVSSAAGNISCAVYANSGSAPTGAPLCQSADTLAVTGLNTLPLSGCGTLSAGTPYWIVVSTNNNSLAYIRTGDSSATDKFQSGTYPTFPTGGTWGTLGAFSYQFYLNLSTGGGVGGKVKFR